MKRFILIMTVLNSIYLTYCCEYRNDSETHQSCPYQLNRRKRAYTRWKSDPDITTKFILKVLDEDLLSSSTPRGVPAVNIQPITKTSKEKIVVASMAQVSTILDNDAYKDYTRFVPPTDNAVSQDVYVAQVPNILVEQISKDRLKALSPQRDDSPPSGPQFLSKTGLLARQFAPVTPISFSRPVSTLGSHSSINDVFKITNKGTHSLTAEVNSKVNDLDSFDDNHSIHAITDNDIELKEFMISRTSAPTSSPFRDTKRKEYEDSDYYVPTPTRQVTTLLSSSTGEQETTTTLKSDSEVNLWFYGESDNESEDNDRIDKTSIDKDRGESNEDDFEVMTGDKGETSSSKTNEDDIEVIKLTSENDKSDMHVTVKIITSETYKLENDYLGITKQLLNMTKSSTIRKYNEEDIFPASPPYLKGTTGHVISFPPIGPPKTHSHPATLSSEFSSSFSSQNEIKKPDTRICNLVQLRPLNFNSPRTLPEIIMQMRKWTEESPIAKWIDITKKNLTTMENSIYMMLVDDPSSGQIASSKRTILIVAGIQGRDHYAVTAAMYVLYQLIERTEAHNDLLSKYRFWVIPVFNPDGYDYSLTFPHRREWTKNLRQSWDECNKRKFCENCDLYGLRCTLQPCYGVHLDRNFEYQWIPTEELQSEDSCGSLYAGHRQLSEPETIALTKFLHNIATPIYSFIAFKEGNVLGIMYPHSHTKKRRPGDDVYRQIASRSAAAAYGITGRPYVAGQTSEFLRLYAGGIEDWMEGHMGIDNTYTIMMYRPGDSYNTNLNTESVVHEAYAAMDTLLLQLQDNRKPREELKNILFHMRDVKKSCSTYVASSSVLITAVTIAACL